MEQSIDGLLGGIQSPADVKKLTVPQLVQLAEEIRERLIVGVSKTGGHIGPNLGVVELTLAMHYVFDTPRDSFVFDVSHQAYVHKLLTGRHDRFDTIRQPGGLNGFMLRTESEHDSYGAGHAGTALCAALGMAVARDMSGGQRARGGAVRGCGVYQWDFVRSVEQYQLDQAADRGAERQRVVNRQERRRDCGVLPQDRDQSDDCGAA